MINNIRIHAPLIFGPQGRIILACTVAFTMENDINVIK